MTEVRRELVERLRSNEAAKRAAKGRDDRTFVLMAREIVKIIEEIGRLPEDNAVDDNMVGSYCWSLYALATKSSDMQESRRALERLVRAYRKQINSAKFWGAPNGCEFGKTLFTLITITLYAQLKASGDDGARSVLQKIGRQYLEVLDLRARTFLDEDAFRKAPVTDEQRATMERNAGKRMRLKFWSSLAEKAFGIMNRCLKADRNLLPSADLVEFLSQHVNDGEWLGFYCANALIRLGDFDRARQRLFGIVRQKSREGWVWSTLAEAFADRPEDSVACYCKALTCSVRDPKISAAMATRVRRTLAGLLRSLGRTAEGDRELDLANQKVVPDIRDPFYLKGAEIAERLVFGDNLPHGCAREDSRRFSGVFHRSQDNVFGFVKDSGIGSVFVPPKFASHCKDGQVIVGRAILKEDKKKKRLGYCMIHAL